ncbi:MAG: VOC family protein, partial [Rhizomicrobium sp.]
MSERPRFHMAFPVRDLSEARAFYGDLLGCPEGRSSDEWVDFDFFGHQIVAHLSPDEAGHKAHNDVDGDLVPVRHFGAILSMKDWQTLADRLTEKKTAFI